MQLTCNIATGVLGTEQEEDTPEKQEAGYKHCKVQPAVTQEQQNPSNEQQRCTKYLGESGHCTVTNNYI